VRSRRPGETATVFLPSVPVLLGLASELEKQRDHVLGAPHRAAEGWDDEALAHANAQLDEPGEQERAFTALGASAELDQVIYDGASFGTAAMATTDDEQDYLGLPGLLQPDQMRALLRRRQEQQLARATERSSASSVTTRSPTTRSPTMREHLAGLRRELNTLVAMAHHRTGRPHAAIHQDVRTACGGPPTAMATTDDLKKRIAYLRSL
ncbi:MAG TPA: ATP-dependent helicase, partial [Pseudonocardiaceae bacterium]|nr:ATP-dependent helicase [Pseudonocardiaceae bacterium]